MALHVVNVPSASITASLPNLLTSWWTRRVRPGCGRLPGDPLHNHGITPSCRSHPLPFTLCSQPRAVRERRPEGQLHGFIVGINASTDFFDGHTAPCELLMKEIGVASGGEDDRAPWVRGRETWTAPVVVRFQALPRVAGAMKLC